MNKEALHKLAAESLNEGLRLDEWDKIGCVNHDCDQCKAQQEPVAWMNPHGGMLTANYIENFASGLDKEIHNIPLYTTPQAQPAQQEPLTPAQKIALAEDWFAEDWAITKAVGMMVEYEMRIAHGITKGGAQ